MSRRRHRATVGTPSTPSSDTDEGWAKEQPRLLAARLARLPRVLLRQLLTEPHSTKQIEDCVGWGARHRHGDDPGRVPGLGDRRSSTQAEARALCGRVRCPVLVIHGDRGRTGRARRGGRPWPAELGGRLVLLEGAGHAPHARDPVKVNELMAEFAGVGGDGVAVAGAGAGGPVTAPATRTWTRALRRPKRASVSVLADRARPRPPGPGHRPGAARGRSPTWRSTGWPSTR